MIRYILSIVNVICIYAIISSLFSLVSFVYAVSMDDRATDVYAYIGKDACLPCEIPTSESFWQLKWRQDSPYSKLLYSWYARSQSLLNSRYAINGTDLHIKNITVKEDKTHYSCSVTTTVIKQAYVQLHVLDSSHGRFILSNSDVAGIKAMAEIYPLTSGDTLMLTANASNYRGVADIQWKQDGEILGDNHTIESFELERGYKNIVSKLTVVLSTSRDGRVFAATVVGLDGEIWAQKNITLQGLHVVDRILSTTTNTPKEKNASLSQTAELSADVSVRCQTADHQNIYQMLVVITSLLVICMFIIVISFVALACLILKMKNDNRKIHPEEEKKMLNEA